MRQRLRILALVPPDKNARRNAAYTVLQEELMAFDNAGVEVHVVNPHTKSVARVQQTTMHPIPRIREMWHTLRSLPRIRSRAIQRGGIASRFFQQLRIARYDLAIESIIRAHAIDLVYSPFGWPPGTAGIEPAHRVGIPVVVSLRGADVFGIAEINYGSAKLEDVITTTLRRADHVIGVSRALSEEAIALGVPADRTSVVLKGVDVDRFSVGDRSESRRKLGLDEVPTVLFVGNFVPVKGIDTLLRAFDRLVGDVPSAQLVMCGDGDELEKVRRFQEESPESRRVIVPGRVSRELIPDYFRAADVFVLPSLSEGSGNVLLEAAACGCPTIGSNVGGIPDYIEDGVTGLLFESQDDQQLARHLRRLLENPHEAAQMGRAGRERTVEKFPYGRMIDEILNLFQRVVAHYKSEQGNSHPVMEPTSVAGL